MPEVTGPDPKVLREAFGRFPTGVTVVTTRTNEGVPVGFTANSFASVSLDPPMLLVCPGKFLSSYDIFCGCQNFAVSVLAEGQEAISNVFATAGGDRFAAVPHVFDTVGIPLIDGAAATFSCKRAQVIEAGDHAILLGSIQDATQTGARGLGYASGQYFSLGLERSVQGSDARNTICGAVIRLGETVLLEETAAGLRPPVSSAQSHVALRVGLEKELLERGVTGTLGAVYSVFDEAKGRAQHAYLLAEATAVAQSSDLVAVEIDDLINRKFTSDAIRVMMLRFASETRTGNFTLYLGDTEAGGIHKISGGA